MADRSAIDRAIAAFNQRLATDHGLPAVLAGVHDGGLQERSTRVRITEPGDYYLHLIQAADGRAWAALTRGSSSLEVVSTEEVTGGG